MNEIHPDKSTIVRRLSFGSSKTGFPMDKYLSSLNTFESESRFGQEFTYTDNSIERKYHSLNAQCKDLLDQYNNVQTKQFFMERCRKNNFTNDEEGMNREIKMIKEQHKHVKKENQSMLSECNKMIEQFTYYQENIDQHLHTMRTELQSVKPQIAEIDASPPVIKEKKEIKIPFQPIVHAFLEVVNRMGTIEILEYSSDYVVFELHVHEKNISSVYNLTIRFGKQSEIIDAGIQPCFFVSDIIEEAILRNDSCFLIHETMARLHNYVKIKDELHFLEDSGISTNWKIIDQEVTLTYKDISCVVLVPWEYPSNLDQRALVLVIDSNGVKNPLLKEEINTIPNLSLQQIVFKVFKINLAI